jgi:hypothetical protein
MVDLPCKQNHTTVVLSPLLSLSVLFPRFIHIVAGPSFLLAAVQDSTSWLFCSPQGMDICFLSFGALVSNARL